MKKVLMLILVTLISHALIVEGDDGFIGRVKTMTGSAVILRHGEEIPVTQGMRLLSQDTLKTAKDGTLGVILRDNTIFSLGPASELAMEEFLFAPAEGKCALFVRMLKGTFLYLSGIIGKRSPDAVQIETPVGTIGIRGTKMLVKI